MTNEISELHGIPLERQTLPIAYSCILLLVIFHSQSHVTSEHHCLNRTQLRFNRF